MDKKNENLINWLMEGEPWVRFGTMIEFMGFSEDDNEVKKIKNEIFSNTKIVNILNQLSDWPQKPLNSHKSAEHPIHKLSFLADLGLNINDEPIKKIAEKILEHQSEEGAFQVVMNIPKHFGGTGENQLAWALCDAPLILYSLIKFGLKEHPQVIKSINFLSGFCQENGYPCSVSKELGKFRGPGKKSDPCPYANLLMLKVFSEFPSMHETKECETAIDCQLNLWKKSKEIHPYMFYTGTDFRKLKAPFIWYDLIHVLDVLSNFKSVLKNQSFLEMKELLKSKSDEDEKYTPESIWKAWSDFDFGQKKVPSRWLTFLAHRIIKRSS